MRPRIIEAITKEKTMSQERKPLVFVTEAGKVGVYISKYTRFTAYREDWIKFMDAIQEVNELLAKDDIPDNATHRVALENAGKRQKYVFKQKQA